MTPGTWHGPRTGLQRKCELSQGTNPPEAFHEDEAKLSLRTMIRPWKRRSVLNAI